MAATLIALAATEDAAAIAAVRDAAADDLTRRFGLGHWSTHASVNDARRTIASAHAWVVVARRRRSVVGTLTLQTRKPWAIDVSRFTPSKRPMYLVNMAVLPRDQGQGIGKRLLSFAHDFAQARGFEVLRLDAYDAKAGGGGFYARCGWAFRGKVKYKGNPLRYYEFLLGGGNPAKKKKPASREG